MRRGLDSLGDRHEVGRCRLLANLAIFCAAAPDEHAVSHRVLREAEALAERLEQPKLTAAVLQARTVLQFCYMQLPEVVEVGRPAVAQRHELGELYDVCEISWEVLQAHLVRGQFRDFLELGTDLEAMSARVGNVNAYYVNRITRTYHCFITTGDLARSEAAARSDIEDAARVDWAWRSWSYATLGLARFYAGDWTMARSELDTAVRLHPESYWDGMVPSFVLVARAYAGEREALDPLHADRSRLLGIRDENPWRVWEQLVNVVESLAVLGDSKDAADLYPLVLNGIQKGVVVTWQLCLWQMVAGIAAASGEHWDAAQEHFETALRQAHDLPHKIAQPEVRRWYARMLLDRSAPGDHDKARTMLGEAVEVYEAIGMRRHLEIAREMLSGV